MKYIIPRLFTLFIVVQIFACTPSATCTDQIHNGDEVEIDCGGSICAVCPTCTDGVMNGAETGVDCGGSLCNLCDSCVTCYRVGLNPVDLCLSNSNYSQDLMDSNVVAFENGGFTCS